MGKIISYEEASKLPRLLNTDFKNNPIYKEVEENGSCSLLIDNKCVPPDISILARDDSLGNKAIGFYISSLYDKSICIWTAIDYFGEIVTDRSICELSPTTSLAACIATAKSLINTCPICKKEIPYSEQKSYSFAGRCCKDCLPAMKEKYEFPGWAD